MSIPTLETPRLILRSHRITDFAASVAMRSDERVTRYLGGKPATPEEVWSRLLRYAGHWALLDFGYWAVVEKESGRFIGEIGFADFQRELTPSFDGAPEMGWVLVAAAQGKGYATEAARAALAWGDVRFNRTRIVCMIDPQNTASLRVAEKAGFHEFARTAYKGDAVILFER
jgi:RimJ/RimL family protein N-acetyltransferase